MTIQNLLEGYKRVYKQIEENKDKEKEIENLIKKYESGDGSIVRDVKSICTVSLNFGDKMTNTVNITGISSSGEKNSPC